MTGWRTRGVGPPYFRIEGMVLYRPSDLDDWVKACRYAPEQGPGPQPGENESESRTESRVEPVIIFHAKSLDYDLVADNFDEQEELTAIAEVMRKAGLNQRDQSEVEL